MGQKWAVKFSSLEVWLQVNQSGQRDTSWDAHKNLRCLNFMVEQASCRFFFPYHIPLCLDVTSHLHLVASIFYNSCVYHSFSPPRCSTEAQLCIPCLPRHRGALQAGAQPRPGGEFTASFLRVLHLPPNASPPLCLVNIALKVNEMISAFCRVWSLLTAVLKKRVTFLQLTPALQSRWNMRMNPPVVVLSLWKNRWPYF